MAKTKQKMITHWRIQGGAADARPLSDQILSFLHTNFPERHSVGPWSPYRVGGPLREILDPPLCNTEDLTVRFSYIYCRMTK